MQRSKSSGRRYVQSGIPGHSAPGGRPVNPFPKIIRMMVVVAAVLAAVLVIVYAFSSLIGSAGTPVLIGASPTDNMQPFGENLLHYDGMALRCIAPNGSQKWEFALGVGADFYCTKDRVVAWLGMQVIVLDKNGSATFNDRLDGPIRFARVGETYVAACVGETATRTVIHVFDLSGGIIEPINELEGLYVMDVGFFTSKGQHMWVLSLDTDGNAPITTLKTFEPGRMTTGTIELDNELVYKVYSFNNDLMVVNTTKMQAYNYKCVEKTDIEPVLAYGWLVRHVRQVGKTTYSLMEQMPTTGGDLETFSELRLVTNSQMSTLRLLSPCFGSALSEKGVYGFGEDVVYYAPYGQTLFQANYLSYKINGFICMLDGRRAVVVIGNEVRIMRLPQ